MKNEGRITIDMLTTNIDEANKEFINNGKFYRKQRLTDSGFWNEMYSAFSEHFYDFLKDNGLRIRIYNKSLPRFIEDYSRWKDNSLPDSEVGTPWLLDDNLDDYIEDKGILGIIRSAHGYVPDSVCFSIENEASVVDKGYFFKLMEAFHLPIIFFDAMPEGIVAPIKHWTHTFNGAAAYVIGYDCIDDGGLLADDSPVGKTYELTSELGLKAVVTITEDRRKDDRNNMDYDEMMPMGEYLAEGYIEGYTPIKRDDPKVVIRTNGCGKITRLGIVETNRDVEAFWKYPLWKEYFDWTRNYQNNRDKILQDYFDSFK